MPVTTAPVCPVRWSAVQLPVQWIVGGVIGPCGAPAAVPVMLAPDDDTDRGPTQLPLLEVGIVRGPVWLLSSAAYSPVKVPLGTGVSGQNVLCPAGEDTGTAAALVSFCAALNSQPVTSIRVLERVPESVQMGRCGRSAVMAPPPALILMMKETTGRASQAATAGVGSSC